MMSTQAAAHHATVGGAGTSHCQQNSGGNGCAQTGVHHLKKDTDADRHHHVEDSGSEQGSPAIPMCWLFSQFCCGQRMRCCWQVPVFRSDLRETSWAAHCDGSACRGRGQLKSPKFARLQVFDQHGRPVAEEVKKSNSTPDNFLVT
jgi:hypothetical protein